MSRKTLRILFIGTITSSSSGLLSLTPRHHRISHQPYLKCFSTINNNNNINDKEIPTSADSIENSPQSYHDNDGNKIINNRTDKKQEQWLVVGDGDFSYSAQLARSLFEKRNNSIQITATVLEDRETHRKIYQNSRTNHNLITSFPDQHSAQYGIDVTKLQDSLKASFGSNYSSQLYSSSSSSFLFDRIVFNFPHWRGKSNTRYNRQLLQEFLSNAAQSIRPTGEIHVALSYGQGGVEAKNMTDWKQSWTASQYAAESGLVLNRVEPFGEPCYDLSSHRGVDRSFHIHDPLNYIFMVPDGKLIDSNLQVACRHELRIWLDPEEEESTIDNKRRYSHKELIEGDTVLRLAEKYAKPKGIRVDLPLRNVIHNDKWGESSLLVFLVVYVPEYKPLTRTVANQIREDLEKATIRELQMRIKCDCMVSKPFPYSLMNNLIEDFTF